MPARLSPSQLSPALLDMPCLPPAALAITTQPRTTDLPTPALAVPTQGDIPRRRFATHPWPVPTTRITSYRYDPPRLSLPTRRFTSRPDLPWQPRSNPSIPTPLAPTSQPHPPPTPPFTARQSCSTPIRQPTPPRAFPGPCPGRLPDPARSAPFPPTAHATPDLDLPALACPPPTSHPVPAHPPPYTDRPPDPSPLGAHLREPSRSDFPSRTGPAASHHLADTPNQIHSARPGPVRLPYSTRAASPRPRPTSHAKATPTPSTLTD